MATVFLGNIAPVEVPIGLSVTVNGERDGEPKQLSGKTVVVVTTPDEDNGQKISLDKQLTEVRNAFAVHSAQPAAWVEGHDDFFNQAVARIFNCPVGCPGDWNAAESAPEASESPVVAQPVADVQVQAEEA